MVMQRFSINLQKDDPLGSFLDKKLRLVDAFCNHKIEFSVNLQLLQNFFTDWQLTPSFA